MPEGGTGMATTNEEQQNISSVGLAHISTQVFCTALYDYDASYEDELNLKAKTASRSCPKNPK